MLGSMTTARAFQWTIAGKHPAAGDYIRLGAQSALLDAVADWVVKGYDALQRGGYPLQTGCSWRFWLRGAKRQALICGLCRDSSDRIGRRFPLLVMGEGVLKDLEQTWHRLPERLERTWSAMEYIAAHRFKDLQAMSDELINLDTAAPAPVGGPAADTEPADIAAVKVRMDPCRNELQTSGWGLISLADIRNPDADPFQNAGQAAILCHAHLKACCSDMPRAVFLGGPLQHPYLMVLQQALNTSDFVRLWTV